MQLLLGLLFIGGQTIIGSGPFGRLLAQGSNQILPNAVPSPTELIAMARLNAIKDDRYFDLMRLNGYSRNMASQMFEGARAHANESVLITLLRRGDITPEQFETEMDKAGWSHDAQQLLLLATQFYPSPQDLVTWLAREVYEPKMVEQYGLDNELVESMYPPFAKAGVNEEQVKNYWRAHWQHASWTDVQRFLHWGQLGDDGQPIGIPFTEQQASDWFRLVEIPPFWRDYFTSTAFRPYTRVDIRRMWDLGVVEDKEVIEAYQREGYNLEHARNLLTFAKVERQLPELQKRYRNGWITKEELLSELETFSLKPERVQGIYQRTIKADSAERVAKDKELTKAEIVKGVKKEVITREAGQTMLERLGYDADEARYILNINIEVLTGSPETPLETWRLVEGYRAAVGQPSLVPTASLLEAESRWLGYRAELKARESGLKPSGAFDLLSQMTSDAEYRYRQLLAAEGWVPE